MNQGNNRGSGSDDRYSAYGADRDDRSDQDERDDRRRQGGTQRQQEAYSGGDWLTHRQQGGSDWQGQGRSQSQPGQQGAGSDWQGSGQQPGGSRWSGGTSSSQGSTSVSSSGYGGYEGQNRRFEEGYGEGRYGEYGEGRQGGRQQFGQQPGPQSGREFSREGGREGGERNAPQRYERERWGDWHQEGGAGHGSEWSSQQGSQGDEWGQGRGRWDQPARGGSAQRQGGWEQGREGRQQGRQSGRDAGGAWGSSWEGPTGSEPDMRTHYRGGYGVSDYGDQDPSAGQGFQSWQRRAGGDWQRERQGSGQGSMRDRGGRGFGGSTGAGGYDPNERAYEHFTGADERSDLNRGYGGAGGSAAARRAQRAGPKGYQRSDERIREDLCERLAMSSRVDVREVEVSVSGGVVTLSGTVQDRQQKYRIEDMADEVFGVKDVHNQIRVTRDSAMGREGSGGREGQSGGSRMSQGMSSPSSQGSTAPSSAAGSSGSLGTGIGSASSSGSGTTSGSASGSTSGSTSGTTPGSTSGRSGS